MDHLQDRLTDRCDELKEVISDRFADKRETLKQAEKEAIKNREKYNHAVANCLEAELKLERNLNQAVCQLRWHVANIIQHHRAAAGHGVRWIPMAALEQFVHFDHYRIKNSSVCLAMPDFSTFKTKLDRAESAALQRLTILFENATQPSSGD